jgi:hypothetical protein
MVGTLWSRSEVSLCRPSPKSGAQGCCVTVANPPARPDPATYSQDQQIALGQIPSWDSPDIITNHDLPWTLFAETQVTVRNLSPTVAAVNTQVQVSISPFGIGLAAAPLSAQLITLAPNEVTTLAFPLSQAILQGDQSIGVFVQIYHPNDAVLINDRGAQVITGVDTVASGRNITVAIPVANPAGAAQTITLATLPNTVSAVVSPTSHPFAPFEQIIADLTVSVPSTVHSTLLEATVIAHDGGGGVIGGATLVIVVND